jgi:carboxylesterase type B
MKQLLFLVFMLKFHILYGKQIKCTSLETTVIETKSGKIRGICTFTNANDKIGEDRSTNVYKFLGIPYAEAPINEKRFKEPVKKESWSSTLDTQSLPKSCPQYINSNISNKIEFTNSFGLNKNAETSEDCLFLNIYTSNLPQNSKEKRPVMVVIHGGSDVGQGSSVLSVHEPSIFVAMSGAVVVTLNYRLGIFGNLYFNNGTEFFKGTVIHNKIRCILV